MKAQIAIIAITAFLQASAVPFLNKDRPSLLGSLQENVNNVISQGQEIIDKGKEVVAEHVEDVIDNIENLSPDQLANLIEEFPLAIEDAIISPNDIIEEAKEAFAEIQEGISEITPEKVPSIIQDNFPDIPLTEEDVAHIVDEMQNLQEGALEAINENFNIQNTICHKFRDVIKKVATAFVEQIMKIIHSTQARMVSLIEKGEVLPSRALDVMEKSAYDAINGFEKILKGLRVPEGIIENAIPIMRETTEKNMEIARTYISYLGGSKLGEIVEKIKTELQNGLPSDVAIREVFSNEIQSGLEKFEDLKISNGVQGTSRGFFGNIANMFNNFLNTAAIQEEIVELRQRYEYNMKVIQARIYEIMIKMGDINNELEEGYLQNEMEDMIQSAVSNIRDNFNAALEDIDGSEIQAAIQERIEDMEAEIGMAVSSIVHQTLGPIKDYMANIMGSLEELAIYADESGSGKDEEFYEEQPEAGFYRPEGDSAAGAPVGAFSNSPDWSDPDRIFLTLI